VKRIKTFIEIVAIIAAIIIAIKTLSIKNDIPEDQPVEQLVSLVEAIVAGTMVLVVTLAIEGILKQRTKKIRKSDERRTRTPTNKRENRTPKEGNASTKVNVNSKRPDNNK